MSVQCEGCSALREDAPAHEILKDGWVPIDVGRDWWLCPKCANEGEADDISADLADIATHNWSLIPEEATELWMVIELYGMSFRQGVALEYVYGAGRVPGVSMVDDLRKAVAILEYEIARLEEEPTP